MDDQNDIFYRPFYNDVSPSFSFLHFSPNNNLSFDHEDDGFFSFQHHDADPIVANHHHLPQVDINPPTMIKTAGTVLLTEVDDLNTTESSTVSNMAAVSLNGTKNDVVQHYASFNGSSSSHPSTYNNKNNNTSTNDKRIPKKSRSAGKKDRHSKIVTAQGPRDRRMRLSLDIAKKFFSLQDMLGVDKASKTIQWLLMKSKPAIKELMNKIRFSQRKHMKDGGSMNGTCMLELISELEETALFNDDDEDPRGVFSEGKTTEHSPKEKRIRGSCKAAFHPLARESRAKARARARERTIEKKRNNRRLDKLKQCDQVNNPSNLNHFRSLSPLKKGEESGSQTHTMKSFLEVVIDHEVKKPKGIIKDNNVDQNVLKSSKITRKSSPTSNFNYHNDIGLSTNVRESSDITIDDAGTSSSYYAMINRNLATGTAHERIPPSSIPLHISDYHLLSQFAHMHQTCGKPWEPYNSSNLS